MRFALEYHPRIEADLFGIFTLIENYAGFDVAHAKLSDIENTMKNVRDFPFIGTIRELSGQRFRAIPTADKGVISFRVDDDAKTVFVISVTYAGADWQARVKERL